MSVDDLARGLADGTMSRRRALGVFAGAAAATLVGAKTAKAQPRCRTAGHPCEGNQECCPGLVCVEAAGPGQAARCVRPKKTETCHGKCSKKDPCPKGCECVRVFSGDKCKSSKDCPKGFWCNKWGKCVKRACRKVPKKVAAA